jgi:hypothetical protein
VRYEKDVDAFVAGEARTSEPSTLIVRTKRIAENQSLQKFIRFRSGSVKTVGEYTLVEY